MSTGQQIFLPHLGPVVCMNAKRFQSASKTLLKQVSPSETRDEDLDKILLLIFIEGFKYQSCDLVNKGTIKFFCFALMGLAA